MKVIVADKISERGVDLLKKRRPERRCHDEGHNRRGAADADALIVRQRHGASRQTPCESSQTSRGRRAGVAWDNIDLQEGTRRGVLVMRARPAKTRSASPNTLLRCSSLSPARFPKLDAASRRSLGKILLRHRSARQNPRLDRTRRIRSEVASRAEAFDHARPRLRSIYQRSAAKELQVDLVRSNKLYAEATSSLAHRSQSRTTNMINAASIAKMKKGARIVNAARGELINEADLAEALKTDASAVAALDVFVEERPKNFHANRLAQRR